MSIIGLAFNIINKEKIVTPFKKLLITFLCILIYVPFSILNIGFILSVLATLGIVAFYSYLSEYKSVVISKVKNKVIKSIIDVILTSGILTISVQLLILPVQINSFNIISFTGIISNIFCGLFSGIITFLGSLYILFAYVPILSNCIIYFLQITIGILLYFVKIFSKIAIEIGIRDLNVFCILGYYILIFMFWIKIYLKRLFILNKKKNTLLNICIYIMLGIVILSVVLSNIYFKLGLPL